MDKFDNFDQPLVKDKKILKILYKTEKAQSNKRSESTGSDGISRTGSIFGMNQQDESRMKTSKFLRKATIASKMENMQENWVDP